MPCAFAPDDPIYLIADFFMPVEGTGIVFVAALNGQLHPNGVVSFIPLLTQAAYLRAASTLAHMGLVAGPTFAFLRIAQELSVADVAALLGVSTGQVTAWESGAERVTREAWMTLANRACLLDGRNTNHTLVFPDLRARVIRVVVDKIPVGVVDSSMPCVPCGC